MFPNMSFKTRDTISAENEPDLQRSKTAAEWNLPVAVIGNETRSREIIAEIGWGDG